MKVVQGSLALAAIMLAPAATFAQANPDQARIANQQAGPPSSPRDWREFHQYDYDRLEDGQRHYYANRYYRDGRYYDARSLGLGDRLYRGGGTNYYCRRSDGTTGLIERGLFGTTSAELLHKGQSGTVEDLIRTQKGAPLAASVAEGKLICR